MSNLKKKGNLNISGSKEYLIFQKNGLKIGIFGLVDENYVSTCCFHVKELEFHDPVEHGQKMVNKIRP